MKSTYRILFFTRKTRPNKDGLVTIAIRITIDGESIEFNPKLYVNPEIWNPIGRAEGKTKEARVINQALDNVCTDLKNRYDILFEKYGYVTPEKLRDAYLGVDIQKNTVLSLFELKVQQKQNLVGKTIRSTTLSKYTATKNRIAEFIQYQHGKDDIPVREVNFQFVSDYEIYLKSVCNCGHNSCVKHLRYLKQVITNALKNRFITIDPFDDYKLGYKSVEKEYLLESEVKKLLGKKFFLKRLEEVRDIFVFQCFTGIAYIDAANLTADNIIEGEHGEKWIRLYRQKSSVQANIPLLEIPRIILDKYKGLDNGKLLPMHTNQKMNAYLKEIADLCGIGKRLTTHCGRHTYATIMLTKGVSIESVSKMLGHTNITTTQIYAKVLNQKISKEVNRVRAEFDEMISFYTQR
jgi:site-specific recombinase XerD